MHTYIYVYKIYCSGSTKSNAAPQFKHFTFTYTLYICELGTFVLVAPKAAEPHFGQASLFFFSVSAIIINLAGNGLLINSLLGFSNAN